MTLKVAGAATQPSTASALLDIAEAMEGMLAEAAGGGAGSAIAIQCDAATYNAAEWSSTTPLRRIYTTTIGTVPVLAYDALIGRTVVRHVSAAGPVGRTAIYNVDGAPRIPAQVKWSAATSLPITFLRPLRRYTLLNPARITAGAGGAAFLGISDGGAGEGGGMPFAACAGWVSDPTINAGRWTARHRQASGGAITTDLDSGVPGNTTWHQLGIRYTEGPVPTLEWLMDTVPVFTLSGDANMLVLTSFINGFYPDARTLAGVGTTLETSSARFIVEALS